MFNIDKEVLSDTRIQLHWASQLLSAAADAKLDRADDDSHSNLGWNESTAMLTGRAGVSMDVVNFSLDHNGDVFSLAGKSLDEGASWLAGRLEEEIKFRDYEMPSHAVSDGGVFAPHGECLQSIASLFSLAQETLRKHGELRVWPHHFDMGFWRPGSVEGKSLGGGFSLGDSHYGQPYFYVNPYGIDRPDSLPVIDNGHWTEDWFGAVLTFDEFNQTDATELSVKFVDQAVEVCEPLLS